MQISKNVVGWYVCIALLCVLVVGTVVHAEKLSVDMILPGLESSYWEEFRGGFFTALEELTKLVPDLEILVREVPVYGLPEFVAAIQGAIAMGADAIVCPPVRGVTQYLAEAVEQGVFLVAVDIAGRNDVAPQNTLGHVKLGIDYEYLGNQIADRLLEGSLIGQVTLTAFNECPGTVVMAEAIACRLLENDVALTRHFTTTLQVFNDDLLTWIADRDTAPGVLFCPIASPILFTEELIQKIDDDLVQVYYLPYAEQGAQLKEFPLMGFMQQQYLEGYLAFLSVFLTGTVGWHGTSDPILIGSLVEEDTQGMLTFLSTIARPLASSCCLYPPCKGCPVRCGPPCLDPCYAGCKGSWWERFCRARCLIFCAATCGSHCFLCCCP